MGRTLDQVMADLPPERRERVERRYRELKEEVEGLRELRELAGGEAADGHRQGRRLAAEFGVRS